jgi:hypothetical protein
MSQTYLILLPMVGGEATWELCRTADPAQVGALLASLLPHLDWGRGDLVVRRIDLGAADVPPPPPWKEV